MTTNFVNYIEALALKKLGFDEECFTYYHNSVEISFCKYLDRGNTTTNTKQNLYHTDCAAPLYSQAFKFFRYKYNLHIPIQKVIGNKGTTLEKISWTISGTPWELIDSHEEAELQSLKKLIELCKK